MKFLTLLIASLAFAGSIRAEETLLETVKSTGTHNTLVAALTAAGKAEMLNAAGPYTLFAPTDAAFAALPKGTLDELLMPENKERLGKLLLYHIISDAVPAVHLKTGQVPTKAGAPIDVKVSGQTVTINGAKVVQADVKASNGLIHVIDKVLLPPR